MNRLPYYVPGTNFQPSFPPPPPYNPTTPPPNFSSNWPSPNSNNRNVLKRSRNWNDQYNNTPYTSPKQPYHKRYNNYNRMNTNGMNYPNGSNAKWSKPNNSTEAADMTEEMIPGIVANKKKRKPMSKSYPTTKWDEKDAEKALAAEKENSKLLTNQSLIIRFPDPQLNKEMVKEFHGDIENVHFPQASTPRYCYAHLKEGTNIKEVVSKLEKIPFGQGFLKVELKRNQEETKVVTIRDIDPYTLYVGNLPLNVTKSGVVQYFNACTRIDIGHPKQMKNSRYAFVRFANVDDAVEAYKKTANMLIDSRSMIVRFRRINGVVGLPGENKGQPQPQTQIKKIPEPPPNNIPTPAIIEKEEIPDHVFKEPDLSLVKQEPADPIEPADKDIKPALDDLDFNLPNYNSSPVFPDSTTLISQDKIKREHISVHGNEDEMEDEMEEEEDFDANNDSFVCKIENCLEDECEDYEDDDDYDVGDEDMSLHLNGADNFLPGDDDEDIFNDN